MVGTQKPARLAIRMFHDAVEVFEIRPDVAVKCHRTGVAGDPLHKGAVMTGSQLFGYERAA